MVRCARCAHVWTVLADDEPEAGEALAGESETEETPDTLEEAEAGTSTDEAGVDEDGEDAADEGMAEDDEHEVTLASFEGPSVPPLAPELPPTDDVDFVDGEADDGQASENIEQSQEGIDALFAEAADEDAEQEASADLNEADLEEADAADSEDFAPDTDTEIDDGEAADDELMAESAAGDEEDLEDETLEVDGEAADDEFGDEPGEIDQDILLAENVDFTGEASLVPSVAASAAMQRRKLITGWSGLGCFVFVFMVMAYLYRVDIVRGLPGSAGVYSSLGIPVNIRGLEIRNVTFSWESDSGTPILYVQGVIQNITNRRVAVPTVVFAFLDNRGEELYHWAKRVDARSLEAGTQTNFAARVPSPPQAVENLQVRFAKPH